jgi:hypothetical protein
VACDGDGLPVFDRLRYRRQDGRVFLLCIRSARAEWMGRAARTAPGKEAGHMTASDFCAAREVISCQAGFISRRDHLALALNTLLAFGDEPICLA